MDPTDTPAAPAESSPLADALIDFNDLGGPSADEPVVSTPGNDFLKEFNADVPEPDAPVADPAPDTDEPPAAETPKDDIDEIPEPEKASAAAKENFNKIKESAKGYKAKLEAAEKLIEAERAERAAKEAEYQLKLAELPELSEKAKFAEEAEKELAISRVEGTKEFKATIIKPSEAIEAAAAVLAKSNELDPEVVLDALYQRDPAKRREMLKEMVTGLDDLDKQELIGMARDMQELLNRRDAIYAQAAEAKKEHEELTRANETKAQEKARKIFESDVENAVAEMKKRLPFIPLADGETADSVYGNILSKARAIDLNTAPPANRAFAAAAPLALNRMARQLFKIQEENKTLQARIAEGNATRPAVKDTSAPAKDEGGDFFENLGIEDPGGLVRQLR
jgi:hypothetical protein